MCASCTVIKKTGLGMIRSNNFNVICMSKGLKEAQNTSTSCLNQICERTERIAHFPTKPVKTG